MSFSAAQKHLFYTEIAKLLAAGFGIRAAAKTMLDTRLPGAQALLLRDMDQELESGRTITDAFGKNQAIITGLELGIIGAGERGGRIAQAFQHLADYFGMLAVARREALASMIYPMVLLHLGVFVGVVAPALMMGEKSMPAILLQVVLTLLALYAVCFVLWLIIRSLLRSAMASASVDAMINRIPLIGKARRSMAMARFTKVYHTCLLAGLSMNETVRSSAEASRSGAIIGAGRAMTEALKHGERLGPVFISSGAFPGAFARSYATAEEAGGLDKDLDRWAKVYQDDAARGAKVLSATIPKIMYGFVVIFIVWTIFKIYTGYFGVLDELSH